MGSVNDLDTIACPSVSSLGAIAMEFGMDIIVIYGTFSIIFVLVTTDCDGVWHGYHCYLWDFLLHIHSGDNWLRWSLAWISSLPMGLSPSYLFWWQLMWWVTTVVAVSVCGRSGLWPFRFVAVPVCGRFDVWPFRFVAVPVCGHFSLWLFRSVAVPVCGRFGLWPFRLWPFRFVAVMTFYLFVWEAGKPRRMLPATETSGSCRLGYGTIYRLDCRGIVLYFASFRAPHFQREDTTRHTDPTLVFSPFARARTCHRHHWLLHGSMGHRTLYISIILFYSLSVHLAKVYALSCYPSANVSEDTHLVLLPSSTN